MTHKNPNIPNTLCSSVSQDHIHHVYRSCRCRSRAYARHLEHRGGRRAAPAPGPRRRRRRRAEAATRAGQCSPCLARSLCWYLTGTDGRRLTWREAPARTAPSGGRRTLNVLLFVVRAEKRNTAQTLSCVCPAWRARPSRVPGHPAGASPLEGRPGCGRSAGLASARVKTLLPAGHGHCRLARPFPRLGAGGACDWVF